MDNLTDTIVTTAFDFTANVAREVVSETVGEIVSETVGEIIGGGVTGVIYGVRDIGNAFVDYKDGKISEYEKNTRLMQGIISNTVSSSATVIASTTYCAAFATICGPAAIFAFPACVAGTATLVKRSSDALIDKVRN